MPAGWALLAAADADGAGTDVLGAWLVTAVALGLSLLGRRRLPLGIPEGLFVAGLSGLLLLNFIAWGRSAAATFQQGASLVSLTVVWFIVAVWVERDAVPPPDEELARRRAVRRSLAVHAAAVSGLLAMAVLFAAHHAVGILAPGLVLLLFLLLAVAGGLYTWRRGVLSRYGIAAVLVLLLWLAMPRELVEAWRPPLSVGLLLVGAASLLMVLTTVLVDWRRRVRIWATRPERLTEPPPGFRRFFGTLVAVCVIVGIGGVLLADAAWTPLAVVLAAFAALVVGHRWRSNAVGELGLALMAEGIVTASPAWLPASPACRLLGWAVAGAYLAWLASFWYQQLNEGKPWTTAGRLIPAARHLSYAAVGGEVVLAAMWILSTDEAVPSGRWSTLLAILFMLAHWRLLARDAAAQQSAIAALAACLVLVAALVPLGHLAETFGLVLRPCVLLVAAALALALCTGRAQKAARLTWPWNAYVGGILPGAVAYDLALGGGEGTGHIGTIVAVAGVVLALGVHWRRGLLTARGVL
jgi:hypothetical protein